MGTGSTHKAKKGNKERGLEAMMIDFSSYDLEELYEIKDALNKEIQEQEFKLRDISSSKKICNLRSNWKNGEIPISE